MIRTNVLSLKSDRQKRNVFCTNIKINYKILNKSLVKRFLFRSRNFNNDCKAGKSDKSFNYGYLIFLKKE